MDLPGHQGNSPTTQYSNKQDLKQENLEDLSMEDQSQSVYSQWNSHWQAESRTNTDDPLKQSLKQTFYSNTFEI